MRPRKHTHRLYQCWTTVSSESSTIMKKYVARFVVCCLLAVLSISLSIQLSSLLEKWIHLKIWRRWECLLDLAVWAVGMKLRVCVANKHLGNALGWWNLFCAKVGSLCLWFHMVWRLNLRFCFHSCTSGSQHDGSSSAPAASTSRPVSPSLASLFVQTSIAAELMLCTWCEVFLPNVALLSYVDVCNWILWCFSPRTGSLIFHFLLCVVRIWSIENYKLLLWTNKKYSNVFSFDFHVATVDFCSICDLVSAIHLVSPRYQHKHLVPPPIRPQ